jgi:hypothetical protein
MYSNFLAFGKWVCSFTSIVGIMSPLPVALFIAIDHRMVSAVFEHARRIEDGAFEVRYIRLYGIRLI